MVESNCSMLEACRKRLHMTYVNVVNTELCDGGDLRLGRPWRFEGL